MRPRPPEIRIHPTGDQKVGDAAMHDENQILQLSVPSDNRGQPITESGLIGMYGIRFNRSHWQAAGDLDENCILVMQGYELVIRRTGRTIGIFRRKVAV